MSVCLPRSEDFVRVLIDTDSGKVTSATPKNQLHLTLGMFLAAWDRYTLIAAGLGQLDFVACPCQLHKATVVQLAAEATSGGRGPLVGVLYDELARHVRR